jgi:hypothetical protein
MSPGLKQYSTYRMYDTMILTNFLLSDMNEVFLDIKKTSKNILRKAVFRIRIRLDPHSI